MAGGGVSSSAIFQENNEHKPVESDFHVSPERRAIVLPLNNADGAVMDNDLRDLLISQQVRRIDELERQVDMLEALLHTEQHKNQTQSTESTIDNNAAQQAES